MVGFLIAAGVGLGSESVTAFSWSRSGVSTGGDHRQMEVSELDMLQMEVASLRAQGMANCPDPAATPIATPSVPTPMGQPMEYGDGWALIISDVTARGNVAEVQPQGLFVELRVTVTNNSNERRLFPFGDLVLIDAMGREFGPHAHATDRLDTEWAHVVEPWFPKELTVVFDVLLDSGQAFVLESLSDPTIRVAMVLEQRG